MATLRTGTLACALILTVSLCLVSQTTAWSGKVCSRWVTRYFRERYCAYSTWFGCCYYRIRWVCRLVRENYCCSGWTHNGNKVCNQPVCSPRCFYGGTCINPNKCDCLDGRTGDLCLEEQCASYLDPCFPGWCENNNCQCLTNFTGDNCNTVTGASFEPAITQCQTSFSFHDRSKNMTMYEYTVDSTGSDTKEIIWSNQNYFNIVNMTFNVFLDWKNINTSLPARPNYISEYLIGVQSAQVSTHYTKLPVKGESEREVITSESKTYNCPDLSRLNPVTDEGLTCELREESFSTRMDSGDWYKFTFTAVTGGYRNIRNTNLNTPYKTEYYLGPTATKEMEFRFDIHEPIHCIMKSCASDETPLTVEQDITKNEINTRWSGWADRVSGLATYTWEIFKLEPDPDSASMQLTEPDPLGPVELFRINHTDSVQVYTQAYTPAVPGMYSIILEIQDLANNTDYVRRFVLYDPVSSITLDSNHKLYVSTAEPDTGHRWHSWYGNNSDGNTTITTSWKNFFLNKLHEDNFLLNAIKPYPPQLDDGGRRGQGYKKIKPEFEDSEGDRHTSEITNLRGIVQFEITSDSDNAGGGSSLNDPPSSWKTVFPFRDEEEETLTGLRDGSTAKIWVRAQDAMGNTRVESTMVHFDQSGPVILEYPTRTGNIENGTFPFASRISLKCRDENSGIPKVHWKLRMANNHSIVKMEGDAINPVQPTTCTTGCYRTDIYERYREQIEFDINHCWMRVPKEDLDTLIMELEIEIFNSAMISNTTVLTIDSIRDLFGIEDYFGPRNMKMTKQSSTGVSISWDHAPSCYERDTVLVVVVMPDNTTKTLRADKDTNRFDITGLLPNTAFPLRLYTIYIINDDTGETIQSRESTFVVTTSAEPPKPKGLSGGAIAGIVIVLLLVIIIAIGIVLLWRTGRLENVLERIRTSRDHSDSHRRVEAGVKGVTNRAYSTRFEEDMVYYGKVDLETQSWTLSRKDISLESQIKSGRFAVIYKAKMYSSHHPDAETVVAKVLKENYTEQDLLLMKAKINFYGTEVGNHPNVLKFLGAIDDIAMGPFMVLEYCENGTMKEYLSRQKNSVTEQVHERLFKFSFEISKGMEYLANRNIVHRRLAARNILLTFLNEAKISGFGPAPNEDGDDKGERLPMKWLPPECIKAMSTVDATEKSDVWSYGVVLWEIFTVGEAPFSNIRSANLLSHLTEGGRLTQPEYADQKLYGIMKKCWQESPKKRPSFQKLRSELETLFVTSGDDDYYYDSKFIYDNR